MEVNMALHSYSRIWLHIIWSTNNREKFFANTSGKTVSEFLFNYSKEKNFFMKVNYVNPDHVHALLELPVNVAVEDCVKLLKGASSHYINKESIVKSKFSWGRGYAAFSVSESQSGKVMEYIRNQKEHHRVKSFAEEYAEFIKKHGLVENR
ncbi:MAG: IS200/IS605 family transposase [Ignavibacteriales bacterium]|nr:MAG: IS200/IS605 family transposase [Ignavibacteriales bacterium]